MIRLSTSYLWGDRVLTLVLLTATALAAAQSPERASADKGKEMRVVTVLRDNDCGSDAIARVKQLASTLGLEITIEEVIVETEEQAKALQWPGSPTVRIKGVDIDPSARGKTAYAMT